VARQVISALPLSAAQMGVSERKPGTKRTVKRLRLRILSTLRFAGLKSVDLRPGFRRKTQGIKLDYRLVVSNNT
jgi:hypothetical protein